MDSDGDAACSHAAGFPIRIPPDHSLFAAPRGFSQLTTSFFACLRLGIPTHALSSLTIKSTSHTDVLRYLTCVLLMPVNIQLSKIAGPESPGVTRRPLPAAHCRSLGVFGPYLFNAAALPAGLVGLGRVELPTSPLSGVRSSHLSYRPGKFWSAGGAGRDRTGDLLLAKQALAQLSYSP